MTPEQLVRKVTAITGYTHAAGVEVVSAEPGNVTLSLAKKPELAVQWFFPRGRGVRLGRPCSGCSGHHRIASRQDRGHGGFACELFGPGQRANFVCQGANPAGGGTICVVAVELETHPAEGQGLCAVAHVTLRVVDMPPLK